MSNTIDTTSTIIFNNVDKPEVYTNVENKLLCPEKAEKLLLNCVQIDWQDVHLSNIGRITELSDFVDDPNNFNINTTEELLWVIDNLVGKAYGNIPVTAAPTISVTTGTSAYIVKAAGNGTVLLYKDGVAVQNNYQITRTTSDQTFVFTATAQEEGKLISPITTRNVTVPAKQQAKTEKPTITESEDNEKCTIEATGNGTVLLYKDGEAVQNPCVITRTTTDQTFTFTATAQETGKLISDAATRSVTVHASQEETTYYWYAGWTIPTSENISTIINEEYPISKTDSTTHKAGGSSTTKTGYSLSNPFGGMNNENRYYATAKAVYYVVVPIGMSIYDPEDGSSIMATFVEYGEIENHKIYAYNGTSRNINNIYIY